MQAIRPCLWFDKAAKEAAALYLGLFPDSELLEGDLERHEDDGFSVVKVRIGSMELMLFDAGPEFPFTEAISLFVPCDDQAEVDHLWDGLIADGGEEGQCGWLKDRFGVSWQIVPTRLGELLDDSDPKVAGAVHAAMMGMIRLSVPELEAAAAAAR